MRVLMKLAFGVFLTGNIVYGAGSLNVGLVGNRSFSPSYAVAIDTTRSIAFCCRVRYTRLGL